MVIQVTRSSMPGLEEYIEGIRELWDSHWLTNIDSLKLNQSQDGVKGNYAYFPVVFDGYHLSRNVVYQKLRDEGIYARKYFYPLNNTLACYRDRFDVNQTPVAKYIADRVLTLPLYADLAVDDVDWICDIILR